MSGLPHRRVGELVGRFLPREPAATAAPSPPRPRAPAPNLAGVCHTLDQQRAAMLAATMSEEILPTAREAVSKAIHSIAIALDCARGGSEKELRSLTGRARAHDERLRREEGREEAPAFQRSYQKRIDSARIYLGGELPRLLERAKTDVAAALAAVQGAAKEEVEKAMERPVRVRKSKRAKVGT